MDSAALVCFLQGWSGFPIGLCKCIYEMDDRILNRLWLGNERAAVADDMRVIDEGQSYFPSKV